MFFYPFCAPARLARNHLLILNIRAHNFFVWFQRFVPVLFNRSSSWSTVDLRWTSRQNWTCGPTTPTTILTSIKSSCHSTRSEFWTSSILSLPPSPSLSFPLSPPYLSLPHSPAISNFLLLNVLSISAIGFKATLDQLPLISFFLTPAAIFSGNFFHEKYCTLYMLFLHFITARNGMNLNV